MKFVTEGKGSDPVQKTSPPLNICIVINVLYYLKPFSRLLIAAEPLDKIGSETERATFFHLKNILLLLESGKNDPINIYPFLDKFCSFTQTNFSHFDELDIPFIWDNIIKLVTVVIPPLREIFLGRISSNFDVNGWLNLASKCFHAQFNHPHQSLEELIRAFFSEAAEEELCETNPKTGKTVTNSKGLVNSAEALKICNAKVLQRAPEILVFSIESAHLPIIKSSTDINSAGKVGIKAKACTEIRFPSSFDLAQFVTPPPLSGLSDTNASNTTSKIYELTSVVSLEGLNFENVQAYYRIFEDETNYGKWFKGSGAHHEEVDKFRVIERNFFDITNNNADSMRPKVHPRLLIYVKKGILKVSDRLRDYVSKAGQMRSLGDASFDSAETPEHYDEAKHYYDEAVTYDETLRPLLSDRMHQLEQIERSHKAQSYENQGDISLGKRRFKEAGDLYKIASRCAAVNSPTYARIREKEEYIVKIINLEIANHLAEKGEDFLRNGAYAQGREQFVQALKLNPEYIHLQTIIAGIDRTITTQTSAGKVSEANQAMKIGKYRHANQLFNEAITLVPERITQLKPLLDSLVVLMQGEDALLKQRSGLVALEDKKYATAIVFITEAISLLPAESLSEHAYFLCDRAQVHFEMKDYASSIADCNSALELRPELAIAFLRLGAAQFEMELYDDATVSYEKAIRNDPTLSEQVKVKVRQVNTAKEVLQRKEREAERVKAKEEEKRALEERRLLEQQIKKEKAEKLAIEQAEKLERNRLKEEEKRIRLIKEKEIQAEADRLKEIEKEKLRLEKGERDQQRAIEREKARAEKETMREKAKLEKDHKAKELIEAKKDEEKRQREFTAEIERSQARAREVERENELEKEKARLDREKMIADREKARQEKLIDLKKTKEPTVSVPPPAVKLTTPVVNPFVPSSSSTSASSTTTRSSSSTVTTAPSTFSVTTTAPPAAAVEAFPSLGATSTTGKVVPGWAPQGILSRNTSGTTPSLVPTTAVAPNAKWSSIISGVDEESHSTPVKVKPGQTTQTAGKKITIMARPANAVLGESVVTTANVTTTVPKTPTSFYQDKDVQNDIALGAKISSAWADHLSAQLEATADRISIRRDTETEGIDNINANIKSLMSSPQPKANTGNGGMSLEFDSYSSLFPSSNLDSVAGEDPFMLPVVSPMMSKLGLGTKESSLFPAAGKSQDSLFSLDYNSNGSLGQGLNFGLGESSLFGKSSLSGVQNDSSLFLDLGSPLDFNMDSMRTQNGVKLEESSSFLNSFLGGSNVNNDIGNQTFSGFGLSTVNTDNSIDINKILFSDTNGGDLSSGLSTGTSRLSSLFGGPTTESPINSNDVFGVDLLNFGKSSDVLGSAALLSPMRSTSITSQSLSTDPLHFTPLTALLSQGKAPDLTPLNSTGLIGRSSSKVSSTSSLPVANTTGLSTSTAPVAPLSGGIDSDVLAENVYPNVAWLRTLQMHMYRWSGDSKEWTEFAMHLPVSLIDVVAGEKAANLKEITRLSECDVWLDEEILGGKKEKFIVFRRGSSGLPSNGAMLKALDVVSDTMRHYMSSDKSQHSSTYENDQILADLDFLELTEDDVPPAATGRRERPQSLKLTVINGNFQRCLEIPREVVSLFPSHKLKLLSNESGSKVQLKAGKVSTGRPTTLDIQGTFDHVERAMSLIWEIVQGVGKEYHEVPHGQHKLK